MDKAGRVRRYFYRHFRQVGAHAEAVRWFLCGGACRGRSAAARRRTRRAHVDSYFSLTTSPPARRPPAAHLADIARSRDQVERGLRRGAGQVDPHLRGRSRRQDEALALAASSAAWCRRAASRVGARLMMRGALSAGAICAKSPIMLMFDIPFGTTVWDYGAHRAPGRDRQGLPAHPHLQQHPRAHGRVHAGLLADHWRQRPRAAGAGGELHPSWPTAVALAGRPLPVAMARSPTARAPQAAPSSSSWIRNEGKESDGAVCPPQNREVSARGGPQPSAWPNMSYAFDVANIVSRKLCSSDFELFDSVLDVTSKTDVVATPRRPFPKSCSSLLSCRLVETDKIHDFLGKGGQSSWEVGRRAISFCLIHSRPRWSLP